MEMFSGVKDPVMVESIYLKLEAFERQLANIINGISELKRGSWNVEAPKSSLVNQVQVDLL